MIKFSQFSDNISTVCLPVDVLLLNFGEEEMVENHQVPEELQQATNNQLHKLKQEYTSRPPQVGKTIQYRNQRKRGERIGEEISK
jgi:hypothetical protein